MSCLLLYSIVDNIQTRYVRDTRTKTYWSNCNLVHSDLSTVQFSFSSLNIRQFGRKFQIQGLHLLKPDVSLLHVIAALVTVYLGSTSKDWHSIRSQTTEILHCTSATKVRNNVLSGRKGQGSCYSIMVTKVGIEKGPMADNSKSTHPKLTLVYTTPIVCPQIGLQNHGWLFGNPTYLRINRSR
jgi:hypothetical protein